MSAPAESVFKLREFVSSRTLSVCPFFKYAFHGHSMSCCLVLVVGCE